jgi:PA14 domain/FG-GAP-like repeat
MIRTPASISLKVASAAALLFGSGLLFAQSGSPRLEFRTPIDGGLTDLVVLPGARGDRPLLLAAAYQANAILLLAPAPQGFEGPVSGEYFNSEDFQNRALTREESRIHFPYGAGSPAAEVQDDGFSARWTGKVAAAFSEEYSFYTRSDDGVRLWVDGKLLIDQWRPMGVTEHTGKIALAAGRSYDFKLEYFDRGGGAHAELGWANASTPKAVLDQRGVYSDLVIDSSKQGFVGGVSAAYFADTKLERAVLERRETSVYYAAGNEAPAPGVGRDNFSVRWSGKIRANFDESYTFYTTTDDGVRLWVNDEKLIDEWRGMGATEFSATIALKAGQDYELRMEYFEQGGPGAAELEWASASTPRSRIGVLGAPGRAATAIPASAYLSRLISADFNDDGKPDAAAAHSGFPGRVTIFLARDTYSWRPLPPVSAGADPGAPVAADLDGDDDLDLVVANRSGASFTVLLNDGAGAFTAGAVQRGTPFLALGVADVNGDGAPDVLGASARGILRALAGDGKGGFRELARLETGKTFAACTIANLDGEESLELACVARNEAHFYRFQRGAWSAAGVLPLEGEGLSVSALSGGGRPAELWIGLRDGRNVRVTSRGAAQWASSPGPTTDLAVKVCLRAGAGVACLANADSALYYFRP